MEAGAKTEIQPDSSLSNSTQEDVDAFLARNTVDQRAAASLRNETPQTQRAVLDRGDLLDCVNPSAALMGRIHVAKEDIRRSSASSANGSGGGGDASEEAIAGEPGKADQEVSATREQVEEFVRENKIDETAAKAFREAGLAAQRSVLGRGGLTDCRNPSAVCLARLREAKIMQAMKPEAPGSGPVLEGPALAEELDKFLQRNAVDSRAALTLRGEAAAVQRAVLERGDMHDCQNPSAALMGRITMAKESVALSTKQFGGFHSSGSSFLGAAGNILGLRGGVGASLAEVEDFIRENKIEGGAALQLRQANPQVQKAVIERGGLTDCRDPSAVCLSRLRDARNSPSTSPTMGVGMGNMCAGLGFGSPGYMMMAGQGDMMAQMMMASQMASQMGAYNALASYYAAVGSYYPQGFAVGLAAQGAADPAAAAAAEAMAQTALVSAQQQVPGGLGLVGMPLQNGLPMQSGLPMQGCLTMPVQAAVPVQPMMMPAQGCMPATGVAPMMGGMMQGALGGISGLDASCTPAACGPAPKMGDLAVRAAPYQT